MSEEKQSEVIHCPNCNEDVPKTLYCLNCGYPLYKIERQKPEPTPEPEPEPEPSDVDMSVEIEPETTLFNAEETTIEVDEPEYNVEPEYKVEPEYTLEPEPEEEPEYVPEPEPLVIEAPVPELVFPEPEPAPLFTVEEKEPLMMEEIKMDFAPDPLTKEVMDNLGKNITLKIRLVRLLRDSQVKEETFKKLFDSYVDQGRIWVSRRDEILRRFSADMERMEQKLVSSRKDYELLEIRKSIGDAGDNEYTVKAPAFKWDIENLESSITNRRAGVAYIGDLKRLVPAEEIQELEGMADTGYSTIDEIEGVTNETLASIKETLAEALSSLNA